MTEYVIVVAGAVFCVCAAFLTRARLEESRYMLDRWRRLDAREAEKEERGFD